MSTLSLLSPTRIKTKFVGAYNILTTYYKNNIVSSGGCAYKCLFDGIVGGASTPPTIVGTSSVDATSSSTAVLTMPVGLQKNDVVIISVGSDTGATALPTGWTLIKAGGIRSTGIAYTTAYKIMDDVPDTSVTITELATSSTAIAIGLRNVDITNPLNVTPTFASGTSGMPNCPSITTVSKNTMILALGFLDDDNIDPVVPAGYSNLTYKFSASAGCCIMISTKVLEIPAADDPAVYGGSGNDYWEGLTIAIKPNDYSPLTDAINWIPFISGVPNNIITATQIDRASTASTFGSGAGSTWVWRGQEWVLEKESNKITLVRMQQNCNCNCNCNCDCNCDCYSDCDCYSACDCASDCNCASGSNCLVDCNCYQDCNCQYHCYNGPLYDCGWYNFTLCDCNCLCDYYNNCQCTGTTYTECMGMCYYDLLYYDCNCASGSNCVSGSNCLVNCNCYSNCDCASNCDCSSNCDCTYSDCNCTPL